MSRPTPPHARAAKAFACLLLAGTVLAASAAPKAGGQPPTPKLPATQPKTGEAAELKLRWEAVVESPPPAGTQVKTRAERPSLNSCETEQQHEQEPRSSAVLSAIG